MAPSRNTTVLVPRSGAMDETVATIAARLRDETCLVALAGATPVGCVFHKPRGEGIYFGRLAVLPERRGRGWHGASLPRSRRPRQRREPPR